ncbi:MAG: alkaline phosphatase family protein [Saprospiraceae bacterium]|nr:alkaline phosphatase family protein [Lewinella sp.]
MDKRIQHPKLTILLCIIFLLSCGRKAVPAPANYDEPFGLANKQMESPRLIVFLSVDQMRASYLDRFSEFYTGGLKRLRDQGLFFDNAHHEHGVTLTAAGHATLSTGRFPMHHGIIANDFFNRKTQEMEYAVDDPSVKIVGVDQAAPSHSPNNLKVPAIGDWMKKDNRQSKVYGVAFKDRSAILMAGQHPDQAFWFNDIASRFISSSYYGNRYPQWANEIVGRVLMKDEIEHGWYKKLKDDSAYERLAGPDDVIFENVRFLPEFPHTKTRMAGFVRPETREREMLWTTPFGDELTLQFARQLVIHNQLGADEIPDLLAISCSTADAIGHHFGPDSQEIMDYYLRLDDYLEEFFSFLDERVGQDNYLVVLSADHGVVTMPELAAARGVDAKRITVNKFREIMEQFDRNMQKELGLSSSIIHTANYTGVSLNYEEAKGNGMSEAQLRQKIAEGLKKMYFVEDAFTYEELQTPNPNRPYLELYRRSTYPGRGHDIKLRYKENYLVDYAPGGSSHGSPYDYDNHVPVVFYGFGMPARRVDRRIATVDIAPTLAALMRLSVGQDQFDGSALAEVLVSRNDN